MFTTNYGWSILISLILVSIPLILRRYKIKIPLINEQKKTWKKIKQGYCPQCEQQNKNEFTIITTYDDHYEVKCPSCRAEYWYGGDYSSQAYQINLEKLF